MYDNKRTFSGLRHVLHESTSTLDIIINIYPQRIINSIASPVVQLLLSVVVHPSIPLFKRNGPT
jgi:hypothetical protein